MATLALWFSHGLSGMQGDDRKSVAAALRRRDPALLDLLIEQYEYRLYRYLLYLTGNREIAEDLFQETWMRVLDRGDQYDERASFEAWLFAIARHLVVDLYRRKKPDRLDDLTEPAAVSEEPSPLDQASRREDERQMQERLQRLPAVYREVLLLRFQEDLALPEIAAVIGVPLSTVKSRLYRGLEALRQELGESYAG